jgi:hypothetical protein
VPFGSLQLNKSVSLYFNPWMPNDL